MSAPTEVDAAPFVQHDAVDAPSVQVVVLADGTRLTVDETAAETIVISLPDSPLGQFVKSEEKTFIATVPGLLNADRVVPEPAYVFSATVSEEGASKTIPPEDVWAALYGFWIKRTTSERIPIVVDSQTIANAAEVVHFIAETGLGYVAPPQADATEVPPDAPLSLIIIRSSFWQGAGAPPNRYWLHYIPTARPFPYITSFTRGPNVITTHPLRPSKPPPGAVLYSRYIASVNQTLTLTHINGSDPVHFETYARWQNSERVNVGWREKGPDEKHRTYLADRLADPHIMGLMVSWDGELAGYAEMSWVKEDGMSSFVGGLGDYDQGTHYLAGEEKYRGRHRFTAVMTSLKHCCFLRDPRTDVVVGEPRYDLPIIPRLIAFLPQEFNREFELPHKRAVFFVLRRERFFQAATLY